MKTINKSSAVCEAINLTNAAYIEAGLEEAVCPTPEVLASEKAEAARKAAEFKLEQDKISVLRKLDPKTDGSQVLGIRASVQEIYTGSSRGWKLVLGDSYGKSEEKRWVKIGDGKVLGMSAAQFEKAQARLAELVEDAKGKAMAQRRLANEQERTIQFIKDNAAFCSLVGHSYYNTGETLRYGAGFNKRTTCQTAFIVNFDGSVRIGVETFTVAQWTEIYELRNAQAVALKALKESFKTATVAA